MSIISLPRQHLKHHPDQAAIPAEKPRGVEPRRLACAPGTSADVLRDLRAADAPIPPTALRAAFDRPAPTWLPAIGLRRLPMLGLTAAGTAVHAATDAANAVLDDITAALDELAAKLAEVA